MSSSMPFSRSIVRTASMMSRLISVHLVDQVPPYDRRVRDGNRLGPLGTQPESVVVGGEHLAAKALASLDLVRGAQRDPAADGVPEMGLLAKRPLDPRRGD